MSKKRSQSTRHDIAVIITRALKDFGYDNLEPKTVEECVSHYIDGDREKMPNGVIGYWVKRELDRIEEDAPGRLALLSK